MKLLLLNSEKLLKHGPKEKKLQKFLKGSLIVVVSDGLETDGSLENVTHITQLVPPAPIAQKHISGDIVGFNNSYYKYLQVPAISVILSTLFNSAAEEGRDIVFLCNQMEDNFAYLELIGNYAQAVYGIEAVPLKKVIKGKTIEYDVNPKDVQERCNERFARAQSLSPSVIEDVQDMFAKDSKKKKKKKKKAR